MVVVCCNAPFPDRDARLLLCCKPCPHNTPGRLDERWVGEEEEEAEGMLPHRDEHWPFRPIYRSNQHLLWEDIPVRPEVRPWQPS